MTNDQKNIQKDVFSSAKKDAGVFRNIADQLKLIWRLILDKRVNPLIKMLPIGSLIYLLAPDFIPFIVDDAVVIGLGTYFFIELCPDEVVQEHRAALRGEIPDKSSASDKEEEIIDGEVIE
ncbi:MAG: hypothetical protein JXA19_06830 [Anaerolineales bacterium]|nr:hypothetical protein [Anaerolineales bacterium]